MPNPDIEYLVNFVARLINDFGLDAFDNIQVEEALNNPESNLFLEVQLQEQRTRVAGGDYAYKRFLAPFKFWSKGVILFDKDWVEVTPSGADSFNYRDGLFVFENEPNRPLYIQGYTYDPYSAAIELLQQRSSKFSEESASFSVVNGSFTESKQAGISRTISELRKNVRDFETVSMRLDAN